MVAAAREAAATLLDLVGLAGRPYLLAAPWASAPARTYPTKRLGRVARLLAERTCLPVVVVGSGRDRNRTPPLLAELGDAAVDLVGRTGIPELAALIEGAELVLCTNSLPLHLADAFVRPVVALYSGSDLESQWAPQIAPARLLRRPTWCHPCYAITCPFHLECLEIPPEEVAREALALLEEGAAYRGGAPS